MQQRKKAIVLKKKKSSMVTIRQKHSKEMKSGVQQR